jgi:predicted aspartyl protease
MSHRLPLEIDTVSFPRFAVLALLSLLAAGSAHAADDCVLKRFASVPTTFSRTGRLLLDVSIDDGAAKLLLDTGGGFSMLDSDFVERRGLSVLRSAVTGYGLTGKPIDEATKVARLQLGNTVSRDGVFLIGAAGGDGSDGIFGENYLSNYDIEIDPAASRLNLFRQDHCRGKVVYWADQYFRMPVHLTTDHRPMVEVEIDGKVLRALVDTGASGTAMRSNVARTLFGISNDAVDESAHRHATGLDGVKIDSFPHVFDSMTFGDITLHHTQVAIADIDSGKGIARTGTRIAGNPDQPDMLIGMPLLRRLHLFIAYSEPALYYTLVDERKP